MTAIVINIAALAVDTNLYDQPMSSFQNGIISPMLFRAVIMMLSIRNSAATISQPLGEASASALWVVWGDKIGAFRWESAVTVRYFVT
jgi:hypothetical protein